MAGHLPGQLLGNFIMTKHTSGPWKTFIETDENPPQIVVIAEHNEMPEWICSCGAKQLPKNMKNARLIAAAPELLFAVEEAAEAFEIASDNGGIDFYAYAKTMRAVIAKAKGE